MTITNTEKRQCAEREVKQRKYVYPRLVQNERMTQQKANREVEIMEAIAADYRELEDRERLV
jgi:hypothetical protein